MKKKLLIGTLSTMSVVAPVAALVSCDFGAKHVQKTDETNPTKDGSTTPINNGGSGSSHNGGSTTPSNVASSTGSAMTMASMKNSQTAELQTRDLSWTTDNIFRQSRSQFSGTITKAAADAVDAIVARMNAEDNWGWHTVGDAVLDGLNAVRYAIMKDAQGDKSLSKELGIFITEVYGNDILFKENPSDTSNNNFFNNATNDINSWLGINGKTATIDFLHLATKMDHGVDYKTFPIHAKEEMAKMNPLRLSVDTLVRSEYRVQQIEWKGDFDGHDWKATNNEITAKNGATNSVGINAPKVMDISNIYGGENWVMYTDANANSDSRATTAPGFKNNIYEGFMDAVGVLYDNMDGSHTTGHRQNFYAPQLQTFGYSLGLSGTTGASAPMPYMLTSTSGSGFVTTVNKATIDAQIAKFSWMKTALGLTDEQIAKAAQANPTMDEYGLFMHFMSPYIMPHLVFNESQQATLIVPKFREATKATSIAEFKQNLISALSPFPASVWANNRLPIISDSEFTKLASSLYESSVSLFLETGTTAVSGIYDILGGSTAGIKLESSSEQSEAAINKLFGL